MTRLLFWLFCITISKRLSIKDVRTQSVCLLRTFADKSGSSGADVRTFRCKNSHFSKFILRPHGQ